MSAARGASQGGTRTIPPCNWNNRTRPYFVTNRIRIQTFAMPSVCLVAGLGCLLGWLLGFFSCLAACCWAACLLGCLLGCLLAPVLDKCLTAVCKAMLRFRIFVAYRGFRRSARARRRLTQHGIPSFLFVVSFRFPSFPSSPLRIFPFFSPSCPFTCFVLSLVILGILLLFLSTSIFCAGFKGDVRHPSGRNLGPPFWGCPITCQACFLRPFTAGACLCPKHTARFQTMVLRPFEFVFQSTARGVCAKSFFPFTHHTFGH